MMGFTPPVLSMADRRWVKVVSILGLLLPLVTLLYYMSFISPIREKTILSVLLTIIHVLYVCLLTYHRISATCGLRAFRKTTECKNLRASWTKWVVDISGVKQVFSFALELILLSDY